MTFFSHTFGYIHWPSVDTFILLVYTTYFVSFVDTSTSDKMNTGATGASGASTGGVSKAKLKQQSKDGKVVDMIEMMVSATYYLLYIPILLAIWEYPYSTVLLIYLH